MPLATRPHTAGFHIQVALVDGRLIPVASLLLFSAAGVKCSHRVRSKQSCCSIAKYIAKIGGDQAGSVQQSSAGKHEL